MVIILEKSYQYKRRKQVLLLISISILLWIMYYFKVQYVRDFIAEEYFSEVHIIVHQIDNRLVNEQVVIDNQDQIQEIYQYLADHRVRRGLRWRSGVRWSGGFYGSLNFVPKNKGPIYSLTILGDEYITIQHPYKEKSTLVLYKEETVDGDYLLNLIRR